MPTKSTTLKTEGGKCFWVGICFLSSLFIFTKQPSQTIFTYYSDVDNSQMIDSSSFFLTLEVELAISAGSHKFSGIWHKSTYQAISLDCQAKGMGLYQFLQEFSELTTSSYPWVPYKAFLPASCTQLSSSDYSVVWQRMSLAFSPQCSVLLESQINALACSRTLPGTHRRSKKFYGRDERFQIFFFFWVTSQPCHLSESQFLHL